VAEAANGAQAVALVAEHLPHIAVLDIQMPDLTGIEATRRIKAEHPGVRVLILTAYDDDPYIFALLQAGASGYILKTADSAGLVRAVRAVHRGDSALDPAVTQKVVRQLATGHPLGAQSSVETLTDREVEVLRLATKGPTNKAIGQAQGISDRTVQGHLANAHYCTYINMGRSIEFFVLESKDGVVRAAFNACDVCFDSKKGYTQDGDYMVCNNCGRRFAADQINVVHGGCNPSPLGRTVQGDSLIIQVEDIVAGQNYF
jgi:DNA-binding NarL/FixJ family response regulator